MPDPLRLELDAIEGENAIFAHLRVSICVQFISRSHIVVDTDSCIMVLRRFQARRAVSVCIMSDNGTNFVGAERELHEALEDLD
jgi:hypothetical protein